jgi:hypothetical protein
MAGFGSRARYGRRPVTRTFLLSVSLTTLAAASAHAQAGSPRQETAPRFGALRGRAETALLVSHEVVELDCSPTGESTLDCDVTSTVTLTNPDATDITIPVSVSIERTTPFTITGADGSEVDAPTVRPLEVVVAANGTHDVVIHGHVQLTGRPQGAGFGSSIDGLSARHPLLATAIHHEQRRVLYTRPVRRHFASLGPVEVIAHLPPGWRLASSTARFTATNDGDEHVLSSDGIAPQAGVNDVEISLEEGSGPDALRFGGPYVALGATDDTSNAQWNFRGRVGIEMGILDILVLGASIESNFRDQAAVAALIEATTWSMVLPPALSAGLGPIFQLFGPRNAGLRLAAGAAFYSVGFDATFDVFPADGHWEITLAGRAGL